MSSEPKTIDCDFHLPQADMEALLPYLDPHWKQQVIDRELVSMSFRLTSYPANSPLTNGAAFEGVSVGDALDRSGAEIAIASSLHGIITLHNPDMRAALLSAVNDHMAAEWLDTDPRLRGSILVTMEDPDAAVAEIERLAGDTRFVQVLVFAMQDVPHGRRRNWPIYEAAAKHGLTLAIHAGGLYRSPPSVSGWPSYQLEDYVLQSQVFENILVSLLSEGVFRQVPDLQVVFLESGFGWLPTTLWRMDKTWRGTRQEIPWIDRRPSEIVAGRFFVSLQPVDMPGPAELARVLDHIGRSDFLLYSTDYPHGAHTDRSLPDGLGDPAREGVLWRNALAAYPRLASSYPDAARQIETEEAL